MHAHARVCSKDCALKRFYESLSHVLRGPLISLWSTVGTTCSTHIAFTSFSFCPQSQFIGSLWFQAVTATVSRNSLTRGLNGDDVFCEVGTHSENAIFNIETANDHKNQARSVELLTELTGAQWRSLCLILKEML